MKSRILFAPVISFLIALYCIPVQAAPPGELPPGLAIAQAAQAEHGKRLFQNEGVVGHGITIDENGLASIVVFTEKPWVRGIPGFLNEVPVETRVTGRFYALAPGPCSGPPSGRPPECFLEPEPGIDPTARFDRPVPIGVSTGHPAITAGTIGARVIDAGGIQYALSNNHVFANSNDAYIGDPMLQPGPFDGGSVQEDVYASLYDFEPIYFDGSDNQMDAAIASPIDSQQLGNTTPSDGYGMPGIAPKSAAVDQRVQKYGRTTGQTSGTVDALNAAVNVCYDNSDPCSKLARFVGQIIIGSGAFSEGGDSGSLVVDSSDNSPVALLFAGSQLYTIATPIDIVLNRFGVTIDGQVVQPPPPGTDITLTAIGSKVRSQRMVDLVWSGTSSTQVDLYRNDTVLVTIPDSGAYTDNIDRRGSYTYRICEAGTATCSNESVVNF